jgi:hypothetical protein
MISSQLREYTRAQRHVYVVNRGGGNQILRTAVVPGGEGEIAARENEAFARGVASSIFTH